MIFCLAVKNVFCVAGCQVGSLPHLPLKAAFVGALHFEIEDRRVSFSLWMVIVEMLCQSITNVFVFNIILVDFLDPVDSRLAGLPVVDRFDIFSLALLRETPLSSMILPLNSVCSAPLLGSPGTSWPGRH